MKALISALKYLVAIFVVIPFIVLLILLIVQPFTTAISLRPVSTIAFVIMVIAAVVSWYLVPLIEPILEFLDDDKPIKQGKVALRTEQEPEQIEPSFTASRDSSEQVIDTPKIKREDAHSITDRDHVLSLIREDVSYIRWVHKKYRSDKAIVLEAMNSDPALVSQASTSLKKNKDFIKECWSMCPSRGIYAWLVKELGDANQPSFREAVLKTLKSKNRKTFLSNRVFILKDNPELCDDREIVTAALKHDPRNIRFVSTRLREDSGIVDKDMVLAAVKDREKDWLIREGEDYGPYYNSYYEGFVPERLKSDEDILKAIEEEAWHCVDEWGVF